MPKPVKAPSRPYVAPARAAQAQATRRSILDAARTLFVAKGYAATPVADVAGRAGVAVDTVYATVGRKPDLMRALVESALSGTDAAVTARERDYVRRIEAADAAETKLEIYARALADLQQRLAPVFLVLREAASSDPGCATLWAEISGRRAANMRDFAAGLRRTGRLRGDLSNDEVADIVWSMNGPEHWALLVGERGWTPDRFRAYLVDAWTRLLLAPPTGD